MIGAFSALRRRSILNSPAPQRRYLGASGSVDHNNLRGWIPATAFTMSIQSIPFGTVGGPQSNSVLIAVPRAYAEAGGRRGRVPASSRLARHVLIRRDLRTDETAGASPSEELPRHRHSARQRVDAAVLALVELLPCRA
jgi:hypothetical protein